MNVCFTPIGASATVFSPSPSPSPSPALVEQVGACTPVNGAASPANAGAEALAYSASASPSAAASMAVSPSAASPTCKSPSPFTATALMRVDTPQMKSDGEADVKAGVAAALDYNLLNLGNPLLLKLMNFRFRIDALRDSAEHHKSGKLHVFLRAGLHGIKEHHDSCVATKSIKGVACDVLNIGPVAQEDASKLEKMVTERAYIANLYAEVLEKYTIDECDKLLFEDNSKREVPVPYIQLIEVVGKLFKYHVEEGDKLLVSTGIAVDLGVTTYHAKLEKGRVFIINPGVQIGTGVSCTVNRVYDIASGTLFALKKILPGLSDFDFDQFGKLLKKEVVVLNRIHANGIKPGFQLPPVATFDIQSKLRSAKFVATLAPLYTGGELFDWLQREDLLPQQRIECCKTILQVYVDQVEMKIVNGDIKPENFFLDENDRPHMADVGGSYTHSEVLEKRQIPLVCTPKYQSITDRRAIREEQLKKDLDPNSQFPVKPDEMFNPKTFLKLVQGNELFAIAIVQYVVLFAQPPFPIQTEEEADPMFSGELFNSVKYKPGIFYNVKEYQEPLKIYPEHQRATIRQLMCDMLEHDFNKRPTLAQYQERWAKL